MSIVENDAVTVRYFDYGNVAVKKLNEIYYITDEQPEIVRSMHKLAAPCKLDGAELVERSAAAIKRFRLAFPEVECVKVKFKSLESGVYLVNVTVNETSLIELLMDDSSAEGTDQVSYTLLFKRPLPRLMP